MVRLFAILLLCVSAMSGLMPSAGATPKDIVGRLHAALTSAMDIADVRERLSAQGVEVTLSTPAQFATFLRGEQGRWGKVNRAADIRAK